MEVEITHLRNVSLRSTAVILRKLSHSLPIFDYKKRYRGNATDKTLNRIFVFTSVRSKMCSTHINRYLFPSKKKKNKQTEQIFDGLGFGRRSSSLYSWKHGICKAWPFLQTIPRRRSRSIQRNLRCVQKAWGVLREFGSEKCHVYL